MFARSLAVFHSAKRGTEKAYPKAPLLLMVRGWPWLATFVGIASSQYANLDAFKRAPAQDKETRLGRLNAALTEPAFDWETHHGSLPPTIHSTSHYRIGSAEKPGSFNIARRESEPWMLPADRKEHRPNPMPGPLVDPAAAQIHTENGRGTSLNWQEADHRQHLRLRGLPRQPDWPTQPSATLGEAAAQRSPPLHDINSRLDPETWPTSEALEWGSAPRTVLDAQNQSASDMSRTNASGLLGNATRSSLSAERNLLKSARSESTVELEVSSRDELEWQAPRLRNPSAA